jgi:fatty acid desaturase
MTPAEIVARAHIKRDYSLVGESTRLALGSGLASADWYRTPVPREAMKELMKRSDAPAIRDAVIWLGVMAVALAGGIWFRPTWWCVPFFFVYGTLYGSASDSRWHECGHRTAFKTQWMNDVLYEIASFMLMRNSVTWRWSHARHHTDTIIVGRDAEIAVMRPPALARVVLNFVGLVDAWRSIPTLVLNAAGILSVDEKSFIPAPEQDRAVSVARVHVAIYAATLAIALATWSPLPLIIIGLPRLYGAWHLVLVGLTQHGGLADNVVDFRLNTRTVYMNPISRFLYWNMNYHTEHHMYPLVPFHALPRLHELVKNDLPPANRSIWDAYREMIPTFIRQLRDEDYFIVRELPPTAQPYRAPPFLSSSGPSG